MIDFSLLHRKYNQYFLHFQARSLAGSVSVGSSAVVGEIFKRLASELRTPIGDVNGVDSFVTPAEAINYTLLKLFAFSFSILNSFQKYYDVIPKFTFIGWWSGVIQLN